MKTEEKSTNKEAGIEGNIQTRVPLACDLKIISVFINSEADDTAVEACRRRRRLRSDRIYQRPKGCVSHRPIRLSKTVYLSSLKGMMKLSAYSMQRQSLFLKITKLKIKKKSSAWAITVCQIFNCSKVCSFTECA